MFEAEFGGVERDARCAATVGDRFREERLVVDFFAADRMAEFGEMNADLMGTAGFESALKKRVTIEKLDWLDVSDRSLADVGQVGAATTAVATIADQARFDSLFLDPARNDGEITTRDRVQAELLAKMAFGFNGTGEDHQTTGLAIEPMDWPDLWQLNLAAAPLWMAFGWRLLLAALTRDHLRNEFIESRLDLFALL